MCEDCSNYYLAGIIDGEGCIAISVKVGGYFDVYVCISNTNLSLLTFIQENFGGNLHSASKGSIMNKDCYELRWNGYKAKELLLLVVDKLHVRKERAELFLTFPLGSKHTRITEANAIIRTEICAKMRELNKKGSGVVITFTEHEEVLQEQG